MKARPPQIKHPWSLEELEGAVQAHQRRKEAAAAAASARAEAKSEGQASQAAGDHDDAEERSDDEEEDEANDPAASIPPPLQLPSERTKGKGKGKDKKRKAGAGAAIAAPEKPMGAGAAKARRLVGKVSLDQSRSGPSSSMNAPSVPESKEAPAAKKVKIEPAPSVASGSTQRGQAARLGKVSPNEKNAADVEKYRFIFGYRGHSGQQEARRRVPMCPTQSQIDGEKAARFC